MNTKFETDKVETLLRLAIQEDIGTGDITTQHLFPDDFIVEGEFIAKEQAVIAGLAVVEFFFSKIGENILFKNQVQDGSMVEKGEPFAAIRGSAKALLSGERIALNFLQRLSGIATLTSRFVEQIKPLQTHIMDTRKTIPGWRYLEKYAVTMGGGVNHRMGLYDQVLIKDNHLDIVKRRLSPDDCSYTGAIEKTITTLRKTVRQDVLIEVETRSQKEVEDAIKAGADIILFDNMDVSQIREAVSLVQGRKYDEGVRRPLTEASGNITVDNIRSIAETGVDRISVGAITHSARALDISFKITGY